MYVRAYIWVPVYVCICINVSQPVDIMLAKFS